VVRQPWRQSWAVQIKGAQYARAGIS